MNIGGVGMKLTLNQIDKSFGTKKVLRGISLSAEGGKAFGLLGRNGAGKTTTIKMLCCLSRPSEGDALVGGYSIVSEPQKVKRLIAVSPQQTAVAPGLTVRENL